ncbi:MAG: uroporphyrinogen-III C-methyltransferase [Lysobacterales bacterium]
MNDQTHPADDADEPQSASESQAEETVQKTTQEDVEQATPSERKPAPEPAPVIVKKGGGVASLALLIALGAAGLSGYMWWNQYATVTQPPKELELPDYTAQIEQQGRQLESRITSALGELRSSQGEARSAMEQDLDEVKRQNERLRADREGVESTLANVEQASRRSVSAFERRLGHLETSISALADDRADPTDQLALSEAEYLLRAATERLSLFNDPRGASRALELAAEQMNAVNDPIYSTVRQTLANHRQALTTLQLPDRVALSTELLALARSSVEWPLDARRSLSTSGANLLIPEAEEQGWWPRFKSVLSNVVVVHREKETATVLLTLEEERLLRENVRLQLQVAQLAAARGEQALFESSIGAVTDWINEYYEPSAEPIAAALTQLEGLAATNLNPTLPDISPALRQLRSIRATETLADRVSTPAPSEPTP